MRYQAKVLAFGLAAGLMFAVGSCSEDGGTGPAAVVATIEVAASSDTLTALGQALQFQAVAKDASGHTLTGKTFSWSSTATGVATVGSGSGLATAAANGTTSIRATTEGVTGSATLVVAQRVASVEINAPVTSFAASGDTARCTAAAEDANGHPVAGATIAWSSSDSTVVSVSGGGLMTSVGDGAADVIASSAGRADTASITVNRVVATVELSPAVDTLTALDDTVHFTAVAFDANGISVTAPALSWQSSATGVATVSGGVATAVADGTALIIASQGSAADTATVMVRQLAAAISVDEPADTLRQLGDTLTLSVSVEDANGHDVASATLEWSSSDTLVVTVNGTGRLTVIGHGDADVTASFDGLADTAAVTVRLIMTAVISGGGTHTCALRQDGAALCWGDNQRGELGDSTAYNSRNAPVRVKGGLEFASLGAGFSNQYAPPIERSNFTCGVTPAGVGYCWGNDAYGQVGSGVATPYPFYVTPAPITGGQSFNRIAGGGDHNCGINAGNVAMCWGDNTMGQLGDGSTNPRYTPAAVVTGQPYVQVSGGNDHTCGVSIAGGGALFCWGGNSFGKLGVGINPTYRAIPVQVGTNFRSVSAGWQHTCALRTNNTAFCWGYNGNGELGDGTTTTYRTTPFPVIGGHYFSSLSQRGWTHTCGVATDGTIYCWGLNNAGQLGDNSAVRKNYPVPVTGGLTFSAVTTGQYHTCGLTTSGDVYCWGDNSMGQLGDGTGVGSSTPVKVAFP